VGLSPHNHINISGGGPAGFVYYGVLKELHRRGLWNLKDLKSIHGTSVGAVIAVIVTLGYDWDTLDDYFVKRPWDKITKVSPKRLFGMYANRGLFNDDFFIDILGPLLTAKDMKETITLKEFAERTGVSLYVYAIDINEPGIESTAISHHSHPELGLIRAVRMTCNIPVLFAPICLDGKCFIDGGVSTNIPIRKSLKCIECIESGAGTGDMLAVRNRIWKSTPEINNETSLLMYIASIIVKFIGMVNGDTEEPDTEGTVWCDIKNVGRISSWVESISTETLRARLVQDGVESGARYCERIDDVCYNIETIS